MNDLVSIHFFNLKFEKLEVRIFGLNGWSTLDRVIRV